MRATGSTQRREEDQEDGLEGVVNLVRIGEPGPADAEDHRPMPQQEGFERRVVTRGEKPFQQRPVGQVADRPGGEERAKLSRDPAPRFRSA